MNRFAHILLTRFNVRVPYAPDDTRLDPGWLEHRFDLFERFCWPSVRAQSVQDFHWIVLFDLDTPTPFRHRIEAYQRWPGFVPLYLPEYSLDAVRERVLALLPPSADSLITSRIDNDDAIHRDFLRRVRAEFAGQAFEALNFPRGYVWWRGRIYLHRHESSPFLSLVERVRERSARGFTTVFWRPHTELLASGQLRQIEDAPPMWLQVVHERNVSNAVAGVRRPVEELREGFVIDPESVPDREGQLGLRADQLRGRILTGARAVLRSLRAAPR